MSEGDWLEALVDEARAMAFRAPQEQKAWLERLREVTLRDYPKRDELARDIEDLMAKQRATGEARAAEAAHNERVEAKLLGQFEDLLAGRARLPDPRGERIRLIGVLAVGGHLFPHLGERMRESDAQDVLSQWLVEAGTAGTKGLDG